MSSLKSVLRTCAFVFPLAGSFAAHAAPNEAAFADQPGAEPAASAEEPAPPVEQAPAAQPPSDDPFDGAADSAEGGYVDGEDSSSTRRGSTPEDEGGETDADQDAGLRRVSLTFSPLHLLMPVVELMAEVRVARKFGVAAIGGYGQITADQEPGDTTAPLKANVFELGAQARYYVVGTFDHGMELGAELLYLHLDADTEGSIVASGEGLAVGPFAGYKIATKVGFTFDGQLGFQYLAVRAEAHDTESTDSAEGSDTTVVPLFNANIGWSF